MIKAVIFDLDNTLVDFMAMKHQAIDAAINAMIDAGLKKKDRQNKELVDRISATIILQSYLQRKRTCI
jgi:beta-phosphoglucomutase-like phosphatase (HAD superfamily)